MDACLVLLIAMKEQFSELKLKDVYEMLIMLPKFDAEELELMFIKDQDDQDDDRFSDDEKMEASSLRKEVLL